MSNSSINSNLLNGDKAFSYSLHICYSAFSQVVGSVRCKVIFLNKLGADVMTRKGLKKWGCQYWRMSIIVPPQLDRQEKRILARKWKKVIDYLERWIGFEPQEKLQKSFTNCPGGRLDFYLLTIKIRIWSKGLTSLEPVDHTPCIYEFLEQFYFYPQF